MAVGSAIHEILEHLDLSADPKIALEAGLARARLQLEGAVSVERRAEIEGRCRSIVDGLLASRSLQRLRSLAGCIMGREVPVLLPPGDAGAVGFVAGQIDLVYRDPENGEVVVADYKTDRVDEAEAPDRARVYAPQGEVYARALQEALELEKTPRVEFWFLRADRIETVLP